jgi:alpha-beta hydrolase superfamily lysophospholipase
MGFAGRAAKWAVLGCLALATLAVLVLVGYSLRARGLPDLQPWHTLTLSAEYRAVSAEAPRDFAAYLSLEERLFAELRRELFDVPGRTDSIRIGRYNPSSVPARLALDTPYNRSYEQAPQGPVRGAALLVHGLTDSPYSTRAMGETLLAQGYHIVVLRLPGHGTIPGALTTVTWRDWAAAVDLAARHAAARAGRDGRFVVVGHSTGASLLTLYALRSLTDTSLPRPDAVYLTSAAIGLARGAGLSEVLAALRFIPGFEKAEWLDVLPEYDPYKYNSFPVNAAKQIFLVTREISRALAAPDTRARLGELPRITIFQSLIDATVSAPDVVRGLLARLPPKGHRLVVFDVNRTQLAASLLSATAIADLAKLRAAVNQPFRITVIANRDDGTAEVATYTREAMTDRVTVEPLPLAWPTGVFSLGHVAIPFPGDDPVYGVTPAASDGPAYNIGDQTVRAEAGALAVPAGAFLRIRSNPFFDVIRAHLVADANANAAGP